MRMTVKDDNIPLKVGDDAYSATSVELILSHPVIYHDGTKVRPCTG